MSHDITVAKANVVRLASSQQIGCTLVEDTAGFEPAIGFPQRIKSPMP
jgi:hypothetical protein